MKSILIVGTSNSGKSKTIQEICYQLNPKYVFKLDLKTRELNIAEVKSIHNDTFIIEINNKKILIVAGATTEQGYTIVSIVEICKSLKIEVLMAIVSMRAFERKPGFDTKKQLKSISEIILVERIDKIIGDYRGSDKWNNRIKKILNLIIDNRN